MYNVRRPSKIVAKTAHRGLSKNGIVENVNREYSKKKCNKSEISDEACCNQKLVFHKKSFPHNYHNPNKVRRHSPQYQEMVNYINDSWNNVYKDVKHELSNGVSDVDHSKTPTNKTHITINNDNDDNNNKKTSSKVYKDEPCVSLRDFKPFDLETWCENRLYAYVTGETTATSQNGKIS